MPKVETESRREYLRNYQRRWFACRRAAWIAANGPCAQCGSSDEPEVDHIDPATKDPRLRKTSALWSWSAERREAELAKCQVLCSPCHKRKSDAALIVHGTRQRFRKGCRCVSCDTLGREAARASLARRRAAAARLAAPHARRAS